MIKFYAFLLLACSSTSWAKTSSGVRFTGAKEIICTKEAYNCPSYKGPNAYKRLAGCEEVRMVWKTCKIDIHDLDRDKDGSPCEEDGRYRKIR